MIEQANIVVAMHPDEATEAMVDLSLSNNKPFAVVIFSSFSFLSSFFYFLSHSLYSKVPCCVFPKLFPRKNKAGVPVITYFQFIDYLLEKDPLIKVGYLDFQGRTKVLYKL